MVVLLNGPLGVGKSTLAEALAEGMAGSVMLDGDQLIAGRRRWFSLLPADAPDRRASPPDRTPGGRQGVDERELELRTYLEGREALAAFRGAEVGEPFDVSAAPTELLRPCCAALDCSDMADVPGLSRPGWRNRS